MTELVPVTLREARRFVGEHHRHNLPPRGWKFGVGLVDEEGLVGVGIASRPVARELDDGFTVEIVRVCVVDDVRNGCSMLYGALCRAAKALGYRVAVTYTLHTESGSSLKAAGFQAVALLGARGADTPGAQRVRAQHDLFGEDRRPAVPKIRWRRHLC